MTQVTEIPLYENHYFAEYLIKCVPHYKAFNTKSELNYWVQDFSETYELGDWDNHIVRYGKGEVYYTDCNVEFDLLFWRLNE